MSASNSQSAGTSSRMGGAGRSSTTTTYEETLTILDDDARAANEARDYRTQSIECDNLLTDEDVRALGWDLPTANTFRKAAKALRSAQDTTQTGELSFRSAISKFRSITGLLNIESTYDKRTIDKRLASADLLDEMARSWKIASNRKLSDSGAQPRWALRRAYHTNKKTREKKMVVAFPLCTLRRPGKDTDSTIDVLIGKTDRSGAEASGYTIILIRFTPLAYGTTFRVVHPAPKTSHVSTPVFEASNEVELLLAKNGPLDADERTTLQDALLDKKLCNDLKTSAKELADSTTTAEQRTMWQKVIFQALKIAARLDDTSISPKDSNLFQRILDGNSRPSRSELQDMGYTATEALMLDASWQQLSTRALTGIAGTSGSYSLPDLHRLVAGRPISRAIALVCLYARIGGKSSLQSLLEGTLTFLCNHETAQTVASWVERHARAIAADNPNGGPRLTVSKRLLRNVYILADSDPAYAVCYLDTLINAYLDGIGDTKAARAICQALNQPDDEPPTSINQFALAEALAAALCHVGIVDRIINLIPRRGAVWLLAQTARTGGAAWRSLAETILVTPAPTGTTRIEQLEAACALLRDPVTSVVKDAVSTGTVPDELAAAAALAQLAGSAPTWLNEAACTIDQAQPADQPVNRALRAFYPIWRRHNPDAGLGGFANEAIQTGRPAFAASQLKGISDSEIAAPYQRVLTDLVDVRAAAGNLIAGDDETAGVALLDAIGQIFVQKEADDGDHALNATFDLEVMRLVAACFEHNPDILKPQPGIDPAPLTALYHHVWDALGTQAATSDVKHSMGPFPLEVLCAAGARAAETRSEAALIGFFARRTYQLNQNTINLINQSALIGGQIDIDVFLPAVAYQAGNTRMLFRKLRNIVTRLDAIGFDYRTVSTKAQPAKSATEATTYDGTETQGQLEDTLVSYMRDPRLGEGDGNDNQARKLHRLLIRRHKHRAAGVMVYTYVSPHQLNSLARDLRWTYRLNPRLDVDELARELAARAGFLTEYLTGPFARAVTLSRNNIGDEFGRRGLTEFGGAVFEAVTAMVDLGLLQRGRNQEHALLLLTRALERAARAVGSRPELDASRLADAARTLQGAVVRIFPEQLILSSNITGTPTSSLVSAAAYLLLNRIEHADDPAAERASTSLQTVLDELDRRRKQPTTAGEPTYLPEAYAWLDEIARERVDDMADSTRAVSTCTLHLIQAGAQQGTQRSLVNLDYELIALANDEQMPAAAAGRCLLRFWHTFHVAASWCHTRLQDLIDALAPGITTDILAGIADVEEAAAEEAPTPANHASRLESSAVAAALAAPEAEHVSDPYAKAASLAYTKISTLQHALAAPLLSALIYRHTGPFINAVMQLSAHDAQKVGALLGPVAIIRPWYLAHAALKAACTALDAGNEVPPALHEFAAMLMLHGDEADGRVAESVAVLMDDVSALDPEDRAVISPLIMVRQGGGNELTDTLTSVLAAAHDEQLAKLLMRILSITLPSANLIDAAQQLLFQNLPDVAHRIAHALNAAGRAYLTLVKALVRTEPDMDDDAKRAVRVLEASGIAQLPAVFRDAATTLLHDAQDAHPQPLRARFSASGSFLGFAGDRQDASALGILVTRVRAHARDVIENLERAADQVGRDDDAREQNAGPSESGTAYQTENARHQQRLNEQASTLRDLMRAHAAVNALSAADGLATLHLTIALELATCSFDPDPASGVGARTMRATRERIGALATCLQQPQAFVEAERAVTQLDSEQFSAIEDVVDLLAPQDSVAPVNDEGAARLRTVQRLRRLLAHGLARVTQALATQARELLLRALTDEGTSTATDLGHLCHDLAFVVDRLSGADIVVRAPEDLNTIRYLGSAPRATVGTGRLALWCAAAVIVRSENAYAGFSVLRDIIASYPEPGTFLDELSQTVEQLRNTSASRIDVRIENRELDGTVSLLVRNDSNLVDTSLDVISLELRPEDGSDKASWHHNPESGSAHLDLPAGGNGTTWTPLSVPLPAEFPTGVARIACHLRSGAGNVWEVATPHPLTCPTEPREFTSRHRYPENADITVGGSSLYGRESELDDLRSHLVNLSERTRGIKMVGAKGVGKTALAIAVSQEHLTVGEHNLENLFIATTCRSDPDPTLLLYELLNKLDRTLRKLDRDVTKAAASVADCLDIVRPCVDKETTLARSACFDVAQSLSRIAEDGLCVTFVVDEAQELLTRTERELNVLDRATNTGGVVAWLFVGTGNLLDTDRPIDSEDIPSLLPHAATISVGHFPNEDRARIISEMLDNSQVLGDDEQHRLRFTTDAVTYIAEYAGGHARAALKIGNIVLTAVHRGEKDAASPFFSTTKRFVYAADVQWALTGGGARTEDESAYVSVLGDFHEIEHRLGVEMALRALQKLADEHKDASSVEEIVNAARSLDDERDAAQGELASTVVSGLRALTTRDFITRESRQDGVECYRFSSVLYKRFAHAGYHDIVAARLSEIKRSGHVSSKTRAAEDAERDQGFQKLLTENIRLEERVRLAEQRVKETREWATQQINDERERSLRTPALNVVGSNLYLANSMEGTVGGSHKHGKQTNVQIGNITINYTVGQLTRIEQVLVAAGQGDAHAPTDARDIAAHLPWPTDHQFRHAGTELLAAARDQEATGGDVAALPLNAAPGEQELEHLELQSLADEAYASQFAEASTAMMGTDAESLRAWLSKDANRVTLAKVGVTWIGTADNPLLEAALTKGDADLVGTCRNVCVTAMIFSLLQVAGFDNYSPVATLLAQEAEHLWKRRLMQAILSNDTARLMLVNWNARGGFTSHSDSLPVGLWAQGLADSGSGIIGRSELGRFWQLGAHGSSVGDQNPWNGRFPDPLDGNRAYQLEPTYAPVASSTLANLAPAQVDAMLQRYEQLAYDRSEGGILKVNNLDVLVHALGSTHDSDEARQERYQELVRYFAGIACIRSLRNHASHGAADERRSTFDERCARILFEVTASDVLSDEVTLPPITFAAKRGRNASWSAVVREPATWTFAVTPAGGGVLLETAKLASKLERTRRS